MATELQTAPAPEPAAAPRKPAPSGGNALRRFAIGTNVLVQVLVVAAIVGMVNYISYRQFKRWDFSRNQKYALSPMSKNLVGSLKKPVKAVVFFPTAQTLYQDVSSLLREYEYASGKKLTVEFVDPYRNLNRARELAEKYKFGSSDNIVILDHEGRSKFVNAQDMAELDTSGVMFGQPPTVKSFKGEEAITSALLEVTEEKQNKLYYLTGHGEPELQGDKLGVLRNYLARLNVKMDPVNLNNVDALPADATGLVILGPKTDLSEREAKLVSDFWSEKKGRLFVLLNPAAKAPRLTDFLSINGIQPQNDRVVKTGRQLVQDASGAISLQNGVAISPVVVITPAGREVTKDVVGIDTQLLGYTQSLTIDRARAAAEKLKLTPLMESGEGFWGESEYGVADGRMVFFDPKKDKQGPLTVAVALERGAMDDPRVKVDTARMVVVGNAGFLTDDGLRLSEVGIDFASNALNWLLNREQVAGIPPKEKKPVSLSLDEGKLGSLALTVLGLIPGLVALLGLATWWQRRA